MRTQKPSALKAIAPRWRLMRSREYHGDEMDIVGVLPLGLPGRLSYRLVGDLAMDAFELGELIAARSVPKKFGAGE